MSEETLALAVIGTVTPMLIMVIYSLFAERRQDKKIDFDKFKMHYYSKNPTLKPMRNTITPASTPKETGLIDLIQNLDSDKIKMLISAFGDKTGEYEPETGRSGDIGDIIGDLIRNNPELVKGFLEGIKPKEKNPPNDLI